jgi:hypothetical protein
MSLTKKRGVIKMNKKIIAIIMASSTLLSLAACNSIGLQPTTQSTSAITTVTETSATSAPETTETEETTEETTESEETTTEETSETKATETKATEATTSETTAKPTPKPIGKTTVSNAYSRSFKVTGYGKFTTKYPKVTIEGVSTSEINNEIAKKFSPIAKKNDSVVKYSYYIGKKYVSIMITVNLDAGMEGDEYYVYNVSRETGKKLSKNEMLNLLGLTSSSFNSKVKSSVKKWWKTEILKYDKSKKTKKMYNTAIASKSINSAVPFVNSKGKKCYLLRHMKAPGQCEYTDLYEKI